MSEHIWVEEALGGYLAGGLDRAERERLERHVAECPDCARELEQARGIDGRLDGLFAPIRPAPALEDRMIRAIREQPFRRRFRISGWKRVLAAAAAVVLFGGVGAAFTGYLEQEPEALHSYGFSTRAENKLKSGTIALLDDSSSTTLGEELVDPSIDFFPPAFSLMVKAPSRVHTSFTGGLIGNAKQSEHVNLLHGTSHHGLNYEKPMSGLDPNVPTGSMASDLWGRATSQLSYGLEVAPGKDQAEGRESGKPQGSMRRGFSTDGRNLAASVKKQIEDANEKQQAAEIKVEYYSDRPPDRRSGVTVPGQSNALAQLRGLQSKQRTAEGQTRIGKSNNDELKRIQEKVTDKAADLAAKVLKDAKFFRPGDVFARSGSNLFGAVGAKGDDKLEPAVNLPAPAGLGMPVSKRTETVTVATGKRVIKPADDAFVPTNLAFAQEKGKDPKKDPVKPPRIDNRKIIRSGDIDFEVESFDDAVAAIMKLVNASNGGFVATINSDKLANGKVKGSVVVRVPPIELDDLILNLRKVISKAGDLKGQRIGSQDVTKQYTDIESRLKAARTMEERLLSIIKSGKGDIKDLVAAEKELGVWRTKIEEMEGEIRYYGNQIALSTLTVNLTEKEIRLAAAVAERERVQAGIEVDDVEKAYQDAQKAIAELKGRITKSELKQGTAGQFNALLNFEVAPEQAGLMRDRLRQLGNMVRLEIDRVQHAEGGKMPLTGKVNRGDTHFQVSLYNLANVQPRETVTLKVAAADVAKAFRDLREAVAKVKGRIVNSQLNEQDRQNVNGALEFHIRRDSEAAMQAALTEAGEQLSRQVSRVPESDNVTDAKVLYKLDLVPATAIPARDTMSLILEVSDVATTLRSFNDEVREAGGRIVQPPKFRQERNGKVLGRAVYDVPLSSAATILQKFKDAGRTSASEITPNPNAPDGKLAIARIEVVAGNAELLVPRDQGLWSEVRHGISTSLRGLSVSAGWLIIGVLFVLPWLVLLYVVVWATRKLIRRGAGTGPGA